MKLSLLFVASLSLVACKKKEDSPTPAPAPAGSAMTGNAAAPTPTPTPVGSDVVTADAGGATVPTGSAAGSETGSTGPRPDCVLYAKVAKSCGHGLKDEATIADECERALTKNTVMAGSINIQIACAKADPSCDAFKKCVATH